MVEEKYSGVDGSKVPREEWYKPDESMLTRVLSPEEKVERRGYIEERERVALEEREKS